MSKKPKPEPDNPEQSKRFVETARQVEAETDGKAFARAFKKVVPKKAITTRQKSRSRQNPG